jgi:ABC-type glycerol-3-phosphate transport system substrate-binding protein
LSQEKPPDSVEQLVREYSSGRVTRASFIKRGLALGLALPAVGGLLAACGGEDDAAAPPPAAEPPPEPPAAAPPPEEPPPAASLAAALTLWQAEYDEVIGSDLETLAGEFSAENPDVDITVEILNFGTVYDEIIAKAAAGALPTIFPGFIPLIPSMPDDLATLEDHLSESLLSSFIPPILEAGQWQGRTVAVPWGSDTRALFYRKDLFDEAGLEPPATWDDLVSVGQNFQAAYPDMKALSVQGHNGDGDMVSAWLHYFVAGNGARYTTPDGDPTPVNDPKIVEALQFWADLVNVHEITQENPLDTNWDQQYELFTGELVGMNINGSWLMDISEDSPIAGKWGVAPVPNNGSKAVVAFVDTWSLGASSSPEQLEAGAAFLEFFFDAERHAAWLNSRAYLPSLESDRSDPLFQQEGWTLFAEQVFDPEISITPRIPRFLEWDTVLVNAIQRSLQGNSAETELNDAQAEMEASGIYG